MWYTGTNSSSVREIGYATSPDGLSWTKYSGNPVLPRGQPGSWDESWAGNPVVLRVGSVYHMYYGGRKEVVSDPGIIEIGHATSNDGISWTRDTANPVLAPDPSAWDSNWVHTPHVIYNPSWPASERWKMWYTGTGEDFLMKIGYATSSDGVTWTKYASNPVLDFGPAGAWDNGAVGDPTVISDGSTYRMWYTGGSDPETLVGIGYATSTDGIHWTRYSGNPVVGLGSVGSWEDAAVMGPSVLYRAGKYRMWYVGWEGSTATARIGYASAEAPGSMPVGSVRTDVMNAPASSVIYVLPDWQSGSGHTKPLGVGTAALSDFTALGFMFGASNNTQVMALDTNSTYFDAATGAPKMSNSVLVVFAGRGVNGAVQYYEKTETRSPIYADYAMIGGVDSYAYFDRQGSVVASLPVSAGQAGTSDMFLVEYFKDANNNKVFIVYGFAWKGTYVGGVFFKTYILPNIVSFTHGWYICQWDDVNGNGLPDPYEVNTTPVSYGD